jgi:hypothetical protein
MASEAGQAGRQIWQKMAFLGVLEQSSLYRGFGEKEAIYQKEPKNLDFHW